MMFGKKPTKRFNFTVDIENDELFTKSVKEALEAEIKTLTRDTIKKTIEELYSQSIQSIVRDVVSKQYDRSFIREQARIEFNKIGYCLTNPESKEFKSAVDEAVIEKFNQECNKAMNATLQELRYNFYDSADSAIKKYIREEVPKTVLRLLKENENEKNNNT